MARGMSPLDRRALTSEAKASTPSRTAKYRGLMPKWSRACDAEASPRHRRANPGVIGPAMAHRVHHAPDGFVRDGPGGNQAGNTAHGHSPLGTRRPAGLDALHVDPLHLSHRLVPRQF